MKGDLSFHIDDKLYRALGIDVLCAFVHNNGRLVITIVRLNISLFTLHGMYRYLFHIASVKLTVAFCINCPVISLFLQMSTAISNAKFVSPPSA